MAGYGHFAFGVVLFTSLIVIALCLFRKTDPAREPTRLKRFRNGAYLICGVVMVASLALAGIASLPVAAALDSLHPVFWLEATAIAAIGVSWLVKGQAILRGKRPSPGRPLLPARPEAGPL